MMVQAQHKPNRKNKRVRIEPIQAHVSIPSHLLYKPCLDEIRAKIIIISSAYQTVTCVESHVLNVVRVSTEILAQLTK